MHYDSIREPRNFGKRDRPIVTITRNGNSRHFNVSPFALSVTLCFAAVFFVGYFGATAYLVFRDDIIHSSIVRQAAMKHEYEDRIATLRSNLDKVTSRQLLDQQALEMRVANLLDRQENLGRRSSMMKQILAKAEGKNLGRTTNRTPVPTQNPRKKSPSTDPLKTGSIAPVSNINVASLGSGFTIRGTSSQTTFATNDYTTSPTYAAQRPTESHFASVAQSIAAIEESQLQQVVSLQSNLMNASDRLTKILGSIGLKAEPAPSFGIGGPLHDASEIKDFESHLTALEKTMDHNEKLVAKLHAAPIGTPVKNPIVSSHFGTRIDPFTRRQAMHSGIDFKAATGTPVLATASGKVVHAGTKGGYGKLVAIEHDNGLITRYGHLSKITVSLGAKISKNAVIGRVGSTGRSTGPHLHYEVRYQDSPMNPVKFLRAGHAAKKLL